LDLMEAEGFPRRVAQEARKDAGLKTWQQGFQGPWQWGRRKPRPRKLRREQPQ
jgi:hypothetical protein